MQLLLKTKSHFTIALWMLVRLSATTSASLNRWGGPWWDGSRRPLNIKEDILSTYYKYAVPTITQKLNVSGHMFIWTIFLVLVCGTRTQNVSAPSIYAEYKNKLCEKIWYDWKAVTGEGLPHYSATLIQQDSGVLIYQHTSISEHFSP
jgi:hypothetical protein